AEAGTQAGGVDEGDAGHVDEEPRVARQLGQGLAELADGECVELTDRPADGVAVRLVELDVEHVSSCRVRRPTAARASSGVRIVPTLNQPLPSRSMARVLVAADAEWLHNEIRSVLGGPDTTVDSVYSGP